MSDPQHELKMWLRERLSTDRRPACRAQLAAHLRLNPDAITRMTNVDGTKAARRIEAHHVPVMVRFFNDIPLGFDFTESRWYFGA